MEAIFDRIRNADKEMVIELSASYIEIYRETLFDLLARMYFIIFFYILKSL